MLKVQPVTCDASGVRPERECAEEQLRPGFAWEREFPASSDCMYVWSEQIGHSMKGLGVFLVLGMILVFVLLFGYWLRTPYAISTQWHHPIDRGLEITDLTVDRPAP